MPQTTSTAPNRPHVNRQDDRIPVENQSTNVFIADEGFDFSNEEQVQEQPTQFVISVNILKSLETQYQPSILRNGYPNWGLSDSKIKILEGINQEDSGKINAILSALMPYLKLTLVRNAEGCGGEEEGTQEGENTNTSVTDDSYSDDALTSLQMQNDLFTNDELMNTISNSLVDLGEFDFLSFGRNRMSIKQLSIDVEETTGLYSVKRFKFSFVVHSPNAFIDYEFLKSLFNPCRIFMLQYGYNIDMTNEDLKGTASLIAEIIGASNKETISFMKWNLKQSENDQNIEIEAEAIPVSSKSLVTSKFGEHILSEEGNLSSVQEYEQALEAMNETENTGRVNQQQQTRQRERLRNQIQSKINDLVVKAFQKAVSQQNIPRPNSLIKMSDILNELAKCIQYSVNKRQEAKFQFVCGYFNDSILSTDSNNYIGDFQIDARAFETFNSKIAQEKNIPHSLDYLDQVIDKFMGDYTCFANISPEINSIIAERTRAETQLTGRGSNAQSVQQANEQLVQINKRLEKLKIPNMKFFVHEHRTDNDGIIYYCFIIDASYGMPTIYSDSQQTALEKVLLSNRGIGTTELSDDSSLNEDDAINSTPVFEGQQVSSVNPTRNNNFEIPIINLYSENTIIKTFSLDSETDEELQASMIKRMTSTSDPNETTTEGDQQVEQMAYNDQFKFLTTKISATTLGILSWQIYQPIFFRLFGNNSIFARLYNITKLSHNIQQGSIDTSIDCTLQIV